MELQPVSPEDLPLWEALQCDPLVMAELGGPHPKEKMPKIFANTLHYVETGRGWAYKIMTDDNPRQAAGTISLWEGEWNGELLNEMGWMVLPTYQGRGLATQAARALLDKARSEKRWGVIHAFTGVTNAASNAICRKNGFSQLEICDVDYADRILHCNHWRIDLNSPDSP